MKAPVTSAITSGMPITPAAHGAARTSRFLLHCRGRQARRTVRIDGRFLPVECVPLVDGPPSDCAGGLAVVGAVFNVGRLNLRLATVC